MFLRLILAIFECTFLFLWHESKLAATATACKILQHETQCTSKLLLVKLKTFCFQLAFYVAT